MKEFSVNKSNNYERMLSQVGKMKIFLDNILKEPIPKHDAKALFSYCLSLVQRQREAEPSLAAGSWSVSPIPREVAEEDRMDYHFFPTTIALATLVYCGSCHPEIQAISGYEQALKKGFSFLMSSRLEGTGYDSFFQQLEIVLILGSGACPAYLKSHPDCAPDLVRRLQELACSYARRLEQGDTILEFGGDYSRQFKLAIQALKPPSLQQDLS